MNTRVGWITLALLAASVPGTPQGLSDADHRMLEEVQELSRRALLASDAAAAAALFEAEAALMPSGAPAIVGRQAIQAFWEDAPQVQQFEIDVLEIDGSGNVAYVRGTYVMVFAGAASGEAEQRGKFLQVLRRQADRRWLIRADMFSPDSR